MKVRSHRQWNFHVDQVPTESFSANNVSYADVNTTTTNLTEDPLQIIQNKSRLRVSVNTGATTKNHATFKQYIISINGQQEILNSLTGSVEFSKITAGSNQTLSVTVVDLIVAYKQRSQKQSRFFLMLNQFLKQQLRTCKPV